MERGSDDPPASPGRTADHDAPSIGTAQEPIAPPARLALMSTPDELRRKAHACRQLARTADEHTAANLEMLGAAYEVQAARLETGDGGEPDAEPPRRTPQ